MVISLKDWQFLRGSKEVRSRIVKDGLSMKKVFVK